MDDCQISSPLVGRRWMLNLFDWKVLSNRSYTRSAIVNILQKAWNLQTGFDVIEVSGNTFLFSFSDGEEYNRILRGRPWSINGCAAQILWSDQSSKRVKILISMPSAGSKCTMCRWKRELRKKLEFKQRADKEADVVEGDLFFIKVRSSSGEERSRDPGKSQVEEESEVRVCEAMNRILSDVSNKNYPTPLADEVNKRKDEVLKDARWSLGNV
ncbi:hypothetical protein K1719_047210 [Acacia pycnantha]|nr:hypothetical protein K1719_047210 [Acacia pycnantha]